MSSPARSSASATSAGQGGGSSSNAAFGDYTPPYHFPADLVSPHERKEEALAVLKSDLMEALQKEVKSLADDNWMFAGPRSQVRTVKVSNVSLGATEQDIKEFFSFSGDIEYVEMQSGDEWSQIAYLTFKDLQGAETAMLLSGATIVDLSIVIAPAPDYVLPPSASAPPSTVMHGYAGRDIVSVSETFSIRKRLRNVEETFLNPTSSSSSKQKPKKKKKVEAKIKVCEKKTLPRVRLVLVFVVFISVAAAAAVLSPLLAARRSHPKREEEKKMVDVSTGQREIFPPLLAHVNPPPLAARVLPLASQTRRGETKMVDVSTGQGASSRFITSMLAKGFILGKDAVTKAKTFDEKHQLTSTATAKVVSLDKKIGLSEKITMGTSAVNEKVKEMDQKFQVSEKTKSAFAASKQKVSCAGSAIMKNRYVLTSASCVTGAFSKVAKAASDVGTKTKEKVIATAKVVSLDKKIGLSKKITMGTSTVNVKVKKMDQKFQVSEKTKSAFAAAEQKVSSAGSAIMKNRYVLNSASWVTGAFSKVAKAVSDVGTKTKEKVVAEEAQHKGLEGEFDRIRLSDESSKAGSREHSSSKKPAPAEGLIL